MLKKYKIFGIFLLLLMSSFFFSKRFFSNESKKLESKNVIVVNKETFMNHINNLLEKGYSKEEMNQIYEYMSDKNIEAILEKDYVDLKDFFNISNFEFQNIDRYKAYQTLENIPMKDAVTRVNLKLDFPFYSETEIITNPSDPLVLVNKVYALPKDYEPDDLVPIPSYPSLSLRKIAIDDFEKLLAAARLDNVFLIPYSTYRTYSYQEELYNRYLEKDNPETVDTYSARPGHSEHQTGLAIDIKSAEHWYNLTDADYEWMKNNSYKYGFIIRYPKDNSFITGYMEEPWHIRHIGVEHATKIHELNITYDEYYDIYLTKH